MKLRIVKLIILSFILLGVGLKVHASTSVCIKEICIQVEVVRSLEDTQRGLQGRKSLEDGHGMLFVFNRDAFHSFWMKDMQFAIDMIWIDEQHRIVTIAPDRLPCQQTPCETYFPSQKARYVLELPAGFASKHQFQEGDFVELRGHELRGHNT